MREPLEVIAEIRGFISSQNPFRFPFQEETIVNLLNELENSLTPQPVVEEILVVEEPIVEEPIVEEVTVEETPVVEEPIVEEVAVKPTNKRPRKK